MKIIALALGLLGFIAGAGSMLVAYPFLFPPPVLNEAAPAAASQDQTQTATPLGVFTFDQDAPGRDPVHWANGTGGIYRDADGRLVIRFEEDFEAGPGPNYIVYLNTRPVGEESAFLADEGRRAIGPLRSFRGGQNYMLPAGLDLAQFHTLTIWCETFGVYIGSAVLPPAPKL